MDGLDFDAFQICFYQNETQLRASSKLTRLRSAAQVENSCILILDQSLRESDLVLVGNVHEIHVAVFLATEEDIIGDHQHWIDRLLQLDSLDNPWLCGLLERKNLQESFFAANNEFFVIFDELARERTSAKLNWERSLAIHCQIEELLHFLVAQIHNLFMALSDNKFYWLLCIA